MAKSVGGTSIGAAAREVVEEMRGVQLGDERRNARMLEVMRQLASSPSSSFASMCSTEAELEAMYRLLRNSHVEWADILAPHSERTLARARKAKRVLALHDTSGLRVAEDADFESYLQTGKRGFFAHVSMLVDPDERLPLGVAAVEILKRAKKQNRTKKNGRALSGAQTRRLRDRESLRWWRGVEEVERNLEDEDVIHVMDREGDSYELLSKLKTKGCSFVIRWCKDRNARTREQEQWSQLSELLEQARTIRTRREVHLSKRAAKTAPSANRATPARQERKASLRISYFTVELKKPQYLPLSEGFPPSLTVNVVRVFEPDPPDGEEPVEWVLLTSLPVSKAFEVEEVVDIYRQRWLVEEFFKALKTGCSYRKRRLTNAHSILNSFAALIPVAWKALAVRRAATTPEGQPRIPATRVLDREELAVLKAKAKEMGNPLPARPSASDALALIARFGGHRKSSGPPGWLTIMRGIEKLEGLAEGWRLAQAGEM